MTFDTRHPVSLYKLNHSHEELVGLGLRGTVRVGRVEEIVDAHEHLLDRDRRPPPLIFVQNAVKPISKARHMSRYGSRRRGRMYVRVFHVTLRRDTANQQKPDTCHVTLRGETVAFQGFTLLFGAKRPISKS